MCCWQFPGGSLQLKTLPLHACSIQKADDGRDQYLSEAEQLAVNIAARQLPVAKKQLVAILCNNAGHQMAGRCTDLAHQTWSRMLIELVPAKPGPIPLFDLVTRQGKTAQGEKPLCSATCLISCRRHAMA